MAGQGSLSIWGTGERMARFGLKVSEARLGFLKDKRARQLARLVKKYEKINPKKARRFEERLAIVS